jgi:hypothetical protein
MNRKNILSEGFFDSLKKFIKDRKKLSKKERSYMKDKEFREIIKRFDKAVADLDAAKEKYYKKGSN